MLPEALAPRVTFQPRVNKILNCYLITYIILFCYIITIVLLYHSVCCVVLCCVVLCCVVLCQSLSTTHASLSSALETSLL